MAKIENCADHKKDILGISDMKQLAELIGDLHYETMFNLFRELTWKFDRDGKKDLNSGKINLGCKLMDARLKAFTLSEEIRECWQISKPFMKK